MIDISKISFPELLQFDGSNKVNFSNVHHAQFHRKQYELVKAADAQKLRLPKDLLKGWEQLIELETEINREAQTSPLTAALLDKDRERDDLLTNLFAMVAAVRTSPVKPLAEAYKVLSVVIKPYVGIQDEPFEDESMHVRGLEKDLAKHTKETAALGLTPVIEALHTANEEYETLRQQRTDAGVEGALPPAKEVRRLSDYAFEVAMLAIRGSHLFASDAADKQVLKELTARINRVTAEMKTSHKESKAQKTTHKATAKDKQRELLQPMLAALESQRELDEGALSFTGKSKKIKNTQQLQYELAIKDTTELLWVKIVGDHLEVVSTAKAKASAGTASASKPKKSKKTEPKPTDDLTAHGSAEEVKPAASTAASAAEGSAPSGAGGLE